MKTESKIKNEDIPRRYVDIKTVSGYTSLPVATLYEWSSLGKIPSIKIGRRVLFDLNEIDVVMAILKRPYNQHENIANKILGGLHGNGI